jgi:Ca-activated chloride channel family protein
MIQVENKYFLFALVLIPLFIIVYWFMNRWRKKALKNYGDLAVIEHLFPDVSTTKRTWKFILFCIAFLLLIIGIANPQVGTKMEEVKNSGADLMICLDVSNSMRAEDLTPNRLEKAKLSVAKLIDKLNGDRIGIIVFAGEAYVQLPITTDYAAAKLFLESINTDMVSSQGTAIGKAIDMAVESFGKDEGKGKAIFIITDGENHEDDAIAAAKAAVEKGINVHTIGMGSPNGSPIPIYRGNVNIGFRKDKDGNTIVTKLNEQMLKEIAAAGNGVYVRASNADVGLNNLLSAIEKLDKKEYESKLYGDFEDRFQWFIAPALLLLLIEMLLTERKSKLFERFNLFGEKK